CATSPPALPDPPSAPRSGWRRVADGCCATTRGHRRAAAEQLLTSYRAGLVPGGSGPWWSFCSGGGPGHGVISGGVGEVPTAPCGLVQIQAPGGADGSESDSSAVSAPLAGRGSGRSAPVPERLSGLRTHRPCSLSRLQRAHSPWPFAEL